MSSPAGHWRQVPELVTALLAANQGSAPLGRFFRQHPRLGRRDRAQVADAAYGCLRHRLTLDFALGHPPDGPLADPMADRPANGPAGTTERARLAAWLCLYAGWSAEQAASAVGSADLTAALKRLRDPAAADPRTRAELPNWLYDDLAGRLAADQLPALGLALQGPAPLDLRVNSLRCKPAAAIAALAAERLPFAPTRWSPHGLRHPDPLPVERSRCYAQGWVEVQDEGSQLVAPLLEPRRGETVVDLCAGAGGKTLHLAALSANQARILAFDPSARRLDELKRRAARAGVKVTASRIDDERAAAVRRLTGKADRVLVDAPCSGSGTLRRDPAIRWQPHDIAALTAGQDRLLDAAARLLRPGGRLVYATCSLLTAENEQRRAAFLERHPNFRPVELGPILKRRKVAAGLVTGQGEGRGEGQSELRLFPHTHGCDGFYAAVLEAPLNR